MAYNDNFIPTVTACGETTLFKTDWLSREANAIDLRDGGPGADDFIVAIENGTDLSECARQITQTSLRLHVATYPTAFEFKHQNPDILPELALFSLNETFNWTSTYEVKVLSELALSIPVIVLVSSNDSGVAIRALHCGAKAAIPIRAGFRSAVVAVRFILLNENAIREAVRRT